MSIETVAYIGEAIAQEGGLLCQVVQAAAKLRVALHVSPDTASGLEFLTQAAGRPAIVVVGPGPAQPALAQRVHALFPSVPIVCLGAWADRVHARSLGHIAHLVDSASPRLSARLESVLADVGAGSRPPCISDQGGAYAVAVQAEEVLARTVMDALPALIAYLDPNQRLRFVSRQYEVWFGTPPVAVYGRHLREVFGESFYDSARLCVEATLRGEDAMHEGALDWADKTRRVCAKFLPDRSPDGPVRGVVCFLQDVSEQRRLGQHLLQLQKLESLGTLAAGLSHDFNDLLTVILGNVSLATLHANDETRLRTSLGEAQEAVERARCLTHELLMFARGPVPVRTPGAIVPLLHETVAAALEGSTVRVEFVIPNPLWRVDFDAKLLGDALTSVMLNAVEAMPLGGVLRIIARNVWLGDECGGARRPHVKVSIIDAGVGIPEEHLSKIFDPYFTTKQCGSGLGLATAYAVIQRHQGMIEVSSKVGRGTCVCVYLPRTVPGASAGQVARGRRREGARLRFPVCDGLATATAALSVDHTGAKLQEGT